MARYVSLMIKGDNGVICNECVDLCVELIRKHAKPQKMTIEELEALDKPA